MFLKSKRDFNPIVTESVHKITSDVFSFSYIKMACWQNLWTRTLDETELILELVKDICNELDVRTLCHKILQNVGILTDADRWGRACEEATKEGKIYFSLGRGAFLSLHHFMKF